MMLAAWRTLAVPVRLCRESAEAKVVLALRILRISWLLLLAILLGFAPARAQEESEEEVSPLVRRGIELFGLGLAGEAIAVLEQAVAEDADAAPAFNALGVIYSRQGRFERAIECFDRAIELRQPYFKAIYNRLHLLVSQGRTEEALGMIEGVVERYPDHSDGWINRGVLLGQLGRVDEALESLDRAIELNADDYDAHLKKGQLLVLNRRYEEALVCFRRALEIAPDYQPAASAIEVVEDIMEKKRQGYIRVRHILVPDEGVARRLLGDLLSGADFAELANHYSADSSARFGGDLGFIRRGELIEVLEEAMFSLEVGQVSGIVRTPRGFHIFKREE